MIAGIYGETQDTWIITTLIHGLEEWLAGFPSEKLTIVTDNKVVRAMAEARSRVSEVVKTAPEQPHALFLINGGFPQARLVERAKKLRIPVYQITGG